MYFIAPGNGFFFQKKKARDDIVFTAQTPHPHRREISKSDRIKANEPCVDWIIQCMLYHGIQV